MQKPLFITLLFCCFSTALFSQNVLAPVDENTPSRRPYYDIGAYTEYPAYSIVTPPFTLDGDSRVKMPDYGKEGEFVVIDRNSLWVKDSVYRKKYKDKHSQYEAWLEYYKDYFLKPPIKFEDCVYFDPSEALREREAGSKYELTRRFDHWPEALRFYSIPQDSVSVASLKKQLVNYINYMQDRQKYEDSNITSEDGELDMHLKLMTPLYELYRPFYFKKTTITNKEYREFVDYVRDSIVRIMLYRAGYNSMAIVTNSHGDTLDPPIINWKTKINFADSGVTEDLNDMFLPNQERFYRRREWDTRKFNYTYYELKPWDNIDQVKTTQFPDTIYYKYVINIYPDTDAWTKDCPYAFCEPLANMYFWHPYYDNYPVVGISQRQAIAFLHWKTEREQKKLDAKGEPWVVKYELPTEAEWEVVETADKKSGEPSVYPKNFDFYNDKSYITDLAVKNIYTRIFTRADQKNLGADSTIKLYNISTSGLFATLQQSPFYEFPYEEKSGSRVRRGNQRIFSPFKADFRLNDNEIQELPILASQYDCNGISFMGCNVSEWMQETYKQNWLPIYNYQHKILDAVGTTEAKQLLATEDYYNAKNDTDGVLVRGANWLDERFGSQGNKNTEGMNAKKFVGKDSCHSTIGFRYVIKLYRKDEKRVVEKIKSTINLDTDGTNGNSDFQPFGTDQIIKEGN